MGKHFTSLVLQKNEHLFYFTLLDFFLVLTGPFPFLLYFFTIANKISISYELNWNQKPNNLNISIFFYSSTPHNDSFLVAQDIGKLEQRKGKYGIFGSVQFIIIDLVK